MARRSVSDVSRDPSRVKRPCSRTILKQRWRHRSSAVATAARERGENAAPTCSRSRSTSVWADRAEQVVGVEPNPEMRRHAEARGAENVSFVDRFADESGLDDGCADIVTIAHAFNWMDPGPTLAEVARVLRPGGLLAIFDYHWPPYITHAIDASFKRHLDAVDVASGGAHTRAIAANLSTTEAIRASGHFAHVRETFGHQVDEIDAEGIVDLARTSGAAARLLAEGWTEDDLALTDLARTARTKLGSGRAPAWIGYQLRLAVTPRESA